MHITTSDLVLDSKIRDWVLIPIFVVMFLVAIFRHHITKILRSDRKPDSLKITKENQLLLRGRRLRANANKIPLASFLRRKHYFSNSEDGIFRDRKPQNPNQLNNLTNNPLMDPSVMSDMMKKNVAMIVPQIFLMSWVSHFFSGFVLVKLPFSLTPSFKAMFQRGIELSQLDVSYVSSLSWYFLVLFGLNGLTSIILGDSVIDDAALMQEQMQMGMGGSTMGQDMSKIYKSERENLDLVQYEWDLEHVEERLILNDTLK